MYIRVTFETANNNAQQDLCSSPNGTCTSSTNAIYLGTVGNSAFFYLDDEILRTVYRGSPEDLTKIQGVSAVDILPIQGNPHTMESQEFFAHRSFVTRTYSVASE
jgi:hypothetical protein